MKIFSFNTLKNIRVISISFGILLLGMINSYAQVVTSTEIGVMAGGSYYLGDINSKHFDYMLPSGGLIIRKNIDRRIVTKAEILAGYIRGNDNRNTNDSSLLNRNLHFRSPIYELSGQIEFNFLPYETGNARYPWSPFIFTGLSIFKFNPQAENNKGEWVDLQPLGTEGQGTTSFPDRKPYPLIQMAIPMGGGVKIAINKSVNIIFEYGIRKTFTDYLDDVSTTYTGQNIIDMSALATEMSDKNLDITDASGEPYQQGSSLWQPRAKDTQRGNAKNNDWYTFTGITLSVKLLSTKAKCNY